MAVEKEASKPLQRFPCLPFTASVYGDPNLIPMSKSAAVLSADTKIRRKNALDKFRASVTAATMPPSSALQRSSTARLNGSPFQKQASFARVSFSGLGHAVDLKYMICLDSLQSLSATACRS